MAPYILFGFLAAGVLSVMISPETVERHLGGRGFWPVFKASLFGVPLPLCSCSVIPVAASLRRHGASRGATVGFLISTPQTGVDSILVTWGLLGPLFGVFRPVAALFSGLVGGLLVDVQERSGSAPSEPPPDGEEACCCAHGEERGRLARILRYAFVTLPRDLARALLLGLLVAGVISALIPDGFFSGALGTGLGGMLLMMLVGIPLYVCATASVPIAAAMILKGVSPGAALVFLMTGPATNAATVATVWETMGPRTALTYLLAVGLTALTCGLALDYLFVVNGVSVLHAGHRMLPESVRAALAVALLALLGWSLLPRRHAKDSGAA
jgi:uncharacterized membrane protein YraQ (UPF0718 family)